MAVKCTECGAAIQDDSKFCKYCGAKIVQENLKRVEVKIDNTAEIKRAEYEEKESRLRQIKMERELRKEKRKPYMIAARIIFTIIPYAVAFAVKGDAAWTLTWILIGSFFVALQIVKLINKL